MAILSLDDDALSIAEAAAIIGRSAVTVRSYAYRGWLDCVLVRRNLVTTRAAVEKLRGERPELFQA